ncbi:MAG TPA: serine protease, partial [Alphaproteobacteria bacterium]|nr:serine protease [Alphaproteobacteria bacterium]
MRVSALLMPINRLICFVVAVLSLVLIGLPTSFAEPEDFHLLAAKLLPAVVNISTVQTSHNSSDDFQGSDSFLEDWFGGNNQPGFEEQQESLGSGFIIDATGYIVTNNHVIEGA